MNPNVGSYFLWEWDYKQKVGTGGAYSNLKFPHFCL